MVTVSTPENQIYAERCETSMRGNVVQTGPNKHMNPRVFRAGAGHSGQSSHTAPLPLWLGVPSSILVCLRLLKPFGSSVQFTCLGDLGISDSSYLPASFHFHPPPIMASRQPAGARPGARFAQFKLVLLGMLLHGLGP